jgi:hypothetical protein
LSLVEMAVSMGGGGVTMNVSDNLPLPATKMKSYPGAVRLASALKEATTKSMPTATVASEFLSFEGNVDDDNNANDTMQEATVGSFTVSVDDELRNAQNGAMVTVANLYAAGTATANTVEDDTSSVKISGDFSFASMVTLDQEAACALSDADLRMDPVGTGADMMRDTTKLKPQSLAYADTKFLCITVLDDDDEMATPILETAPYMVMVTYAGANLGPDAGDPKHPTMGMARELGYIQRDGTTIRLPYLTTNMKFNQMIRIVNRGSMAKYSMQFQTGDTAGEKAKDDLMSGVTVLKTSDVVTPSNGSSTSGTLVIEAQPLMIDVATVQVTRENGASDTVLYTAN